MRLLIYRGDRASSSAFALRNALLERGVDVKVNRKGSAPRTSRLVINWGCSSVPYDTDGVVNEEQAVSTAIDKLATLEQLEYSAVRVPLFQIIPPQPPRSIVWLARTDIRGSGGRGIVVLRKDDPVVEAPLYTMYIPKVQEYRLHVVGGKVVATQQKRKEQGVEQTADQKLIRNRANGWVYATQNVEWEHPNVKFAAEQQALMAVDSLGLDFGAVDLIIGKDDALPYVLEVNSAPGLESPTVLAAYCTALQEMLA